MFFTRLLLLTALATSSAVAAGHTTASRSATSSSVPARVHIRKQHVDRWYGKRRIHVEVDYPEVTGLTDTVLQSRINRTIRSAYPPPRGLDAWLALDHSFDGLEPGVRKELGGQYEITLNRNHLLSVRFLGSDDYVKNGLINGVHPNPISAAVTLDTRTGRPFKMSELFAGPRWRERVEELIARTGAVDGSNRGEDYQALLSDLKQHQYWYFVTPRAVGFYDLYLAYAGRGIETEVPLEQLRPFMNPMGPLPALLAARK